MATATFLPRLGAFELGFTEQWSLHFAQSLGEELTASEAADRTPLLRDCRLGSFESKPPAGMSTLTTSE